MRWGGSIATGSHCMFIYWSFELSPLGGLLE